MFITPTMSLALSICLYLFIQIYINILFWEAAVPVLGALKIPLAAMYASL